MVSILHLVRYKNLLIIALTQYMTRYFVVYPILRINGFELQMGHFHFLLLVLSAVFITAAGYVINDYFDKKTDMLNRPEKVLIGKKISGKGAMMLHILLNTIGVGLGICLSIHAGMPALGMAYVLAAGLLWFYSTTYKRQFLIGNLIVAVFTAAVPFVVVLFEVPLLNKEYQGILIGNRVNFNTVLAWVGGFSYFAFLSTLIREIIKDMEDYEGDLACGRNSLPVVLGIRAAKHVAGAITAVLLVSLFCLYFKYLRYMPDGRPDHITFSYTMLFLFLPYLYLMYRMYRGRNKDDYHLCSSVSKMIMLAGILYSLVFYLILTLNAA